MANEARCLHAVSTQHDKGMNQGVHTQEVAVHVYGAGKIMAGVAKQQCRCSATEKEHGLVDACSHAGRRACIT
jgi:hypothetical protein